MGHNIVPTQTNLPGVELIYLNDRDVAGIHYRGLARLLDCDVKTVSNAAETVNLEDIIELEIQTTQGLRTVKFLLESGVIQVLKKIRRSNRIKKETCENAEDLYDRFATAGFKLYAMLKVAPEALKEKVDQYVEDLEILKMRREVLQLEKDLIDKRDWIVRTLPEPVQQKILGYTTIERVEYRDRILHDDDLVNDGSTIGKGELCRRYGIVTRNGKPDYKRLNTILEKMPSDAFGLTVRLQDNQELLRDWLPKLDRLVDDCDRNLYLGE
jgi:hypothetical protein